MLPTPFKKPSPFKNSMGADKKIDAMFKHASGNYGASIVKMFKGDDASTSTGAVPATPAATAPTTAITPASIQNSVMAMMPGKHVMALIITGSLVIIAIVAIRMSSRKGASAAPAAAAE